MTPEVDADLGIRNYTLVLDNAPFPKLPHQQFQLTLRPNPTRFELNTSSVDLRALASVFVVIKVRKLAVATCPNNKTHDIIILLRLNF